MGGKSLFSGRSMYARCVYYVCNGNDAAVMSLKTIIIFFD